MTCYFYVSTWKQVKLYVAGIHFIIILLARSAIYNEQNVSS